MRDLTFFKEKVFPIIFHHHDGGYGKSYQASYHREYDYYL